ncbi:hypothetical protein SLEP1_g58601 [Rubroshorea leprosula]|uniref:Uncharacterized protein n=1 Tax=Rubroshorea leprosula TaxID=152421 RepID=A0AAV5MQZ9_9ROSI|nr:hypothetical protein SLEP1_g58601 [Rubroshorea leprosula]
MWHLAKVTQPATAGTSTATSILFGEGLLVPSSTFSPMLGVFSDDNPSDDGEGFAPDPSCTLGLALLSFGKSCSSGGTIIAIGSADITLSSLSVSPENFGSPLLQKSTENMELEYGNRGVEAAKNFNSVGLRSCPNSSH